MCANRLMGSRRRAGAPVWGRMTGGDMAALLAAVLLTLPGCGPAAGPAVPPAGPPPVAVRLVDHDGLLREIGRHRGKVVVLDCWSTSCPPCVKEFPGLVALAAKHGETVACLSLAVEYDGLGEPEDFLPPVQAFLEKVGAGKVVNLLSTEEADGLCQKLDFVSVPAVFIWNPAGELAIRYDDDMAARDLGRGFTYGDVEQAVAGLLAE
jgi:thiol-disulfide isomerase/thioredoxin